MNEHVLDWLNAYYDGALSGERQRQVEAHLSGCAACRDELEALRALSLQLRASPAMPARTPPEQFVAQVQLRLPPRPATTPGRARLRQVAGLWLPLAVLLLWAFGQAVLLVSGLILGVATLPAIDGALPLITVARQWGWGGWLDLLVVNLGLTATVVGLVGGCLAVWWAARDKNGVSSGVLAGGTT